MADFTLKRYKELLEAIKEAGYHFQNFEEFITNNVNRSMVLRHDIDRQPRRALDISEIEAAKGIRASYHFRIGNKSNNPDVIKKIVSLGHEVAYHYEDMSQAGRGGVVTNDNTELLNSAIKTFRENLKYLRQFYPVKVISMHGDPKYSTDNRDLWEHFNYRLEGIICEPYLDIDYAKTLYLTDTGRRWNGTRINFRDKIGKNYGKTFGEPLANKVNLRSTNDIIVLLKSGGMPDRVILNIHTQRWTERPIPWFHELLWQNLKNVIKYILATLR
jgi:hypothetical protein